MKYNFIENEENAKGFARTLVNLTEVQRKTMEIILHEVVPKIESIHDLVLKKPEYLSVGQVASLEGVCEKTIRNRIKEGTIPATKNKGERSYKIPSLEYYETRTEVKSNTSYRNVS